MLLTWPALARWNYPPASQCSSVGDLLPPTGICRPVVKLTCHHLLESTVYWNLQACVVKLTCNRLLESTVYWNLQASGVKLTCHQLTVYWNLQACVVKLTCHHLTESTVYWHLQACVVKLTCHCLIESTVYYTGICRPVLLSWPVRPLPLRSLSIRICSLLLLSWPATAYWNRQSTGICRPVLLSWRPRLLESKVYRPVLLTCHHLLESTVYWNLQGSFVKLTPPPTDGKLTATA